MSARLKSRFTVYQFLVRLRGFKPTIWRRLRVADGTLSELHRAIQVSFGIPAAEPFRFVRRGRGAGKSGVPLPSLRGDDRLGEIMPLDGVDFRLAYEAGVGEPWRCHVAFEGWVVSSFGALYPLCVEGRRAGVPNDRVPTFPMDTSPIAASPADACPMDPRAFGELLQASTNPNPSPNGVYTLRFYDPASIDLPAINADLLRLCQHVVLDDQCEPLMRLPLDDHEWVPFWDYAVVDKDERERLMTTTSREAVWLYLPEALSSARNLIMAAQKAESNEARDLSDRLVGRLYRAIVFHRLLNARRGAQPLDETHGAPKAGSGAHIPMRLKEG
jgi:hypothetical protein